MEGVHSSLATILIRWGRYDVAERVLRDQDLLEFRTPLLLRPAYQDAVQIAMWNRAFNVQLLDLLRCYGCNPSSINLAPVFAEASEDPFLLLSDMRRIRDTNFDNNKRACEGLHIACSCILMPCHRLPRLCYPTPSTAPSECCRCVVTSVLAQCGSLTASSNRLAPGVLLGEGARPLAKLGCQSTAARCLAAHRQTSNCSPAIQFASARRGIMSTSRC